MIIINFIINILQNVQLIAIRSSTTSWFSSSKQIFLWYCSTMLRPLCYRFSI